MRRQGFLKKSRHLTPQKKTEESSKERFDEQETYTDSVPIFIGSSVERLSGRDGKRIARESAGRKHRVDNQYGKQIDTNDADRI